MSSKRQRTAAGGSLLPSKSEAKEESQAKRVRKDAKEVQVQQTPRGNEGLTMGGLPLYGESCPKNGYAGIPGLAEDVCSLLRQTMEKAKEVKDNGKVRLCVRTCSTENLTLGYLNFIGGGRRTQDRIITLCSSEEAQSSCTPLYERDERQDSRASP